ncbi:MAG TPA: alpha/beta fold hydrolase [Gammaproteobacteria bacterium]|jgi:pimeloyl-ACP methyl ester carboxylesterase|nr:alpha/beta fold hydrolase [Gammaproteobacteria bacterium]
MRKRRPLTMRAARVQTLILLYGLAAFAATAAGRAAHAAPLEFHECQVGAADASAHLQARCATFMVPEDRQHPGGKQVGLKVALLKARSSSPKPDAFFYIAGGPGQASTESFVQEAAAFDRIRSERDVVLVDQRGTGGSNRMDCPKLAVDVDTDESAIAQAAANCLKQLPGDPRFYTTSVAVQDLDAVRAAMGYASVDLYGISYGTRVALQYLRTYPEHTRSVVLDGVVPADLALGPDVSLDAQRSLGLIFTRCGEDPACHQAFPDPAADFAALQKELTARPATVTLRDPLDGSPRTETLTWEKVAGAVRLMSYQSETASLLPLLIHQAAARHDYAPLMATALIFTGEIQESFAEGMSSSVLCTEDAPFLAPDAAHAAALKDTYLGASTLDVLMKSCKVWPRGVMAPDFKHPVKSGKPVLLLSGEDDPITPPTNAARAAKTLSNSLSLVMPGQGHGNAFRGCVPRILAEFVDAAAVKQLDTGCVKDMKPFPFFVNFSGPKP